MENKIEVNNKDEMNKWFEEFKKGNGLVDTFTNSYSFCESVPNLDRFVFQMAGATDDAQKDSIYASALVEATKFCAPIYECAWASSTGIVKKGLEWFEKNAGTIKSWDESYTELKVEVPKIEQLSNYQQAALKWRKDIGFRVNANTAALSNKVLAEYKVPGEIVMSVKEMLSDMIRRRNLILNRGGDENPRGPVSREHVEWCREFVKGKYIMAFNPPWGDINKSGRSGIALVATGLAKLAETEGKGIFDEAKKTVEALNGYLDKHKDEVDKASADSMITNLLKHIAKAQELYKNSSALRAQGAQIDTVFSSYYWLYKAGVTPETFPTVSQFLFELGKQPRGTKKMKKALLSTPMKWGKKLYELFADDSFQQNRIYMHPAVLTAGRISEMGVCFGTIPVANPDDAALGSGHTKSILNLRTNTETNNPCAKTIVKLFEIQKTGFNIQDMDIVASEHLLHQSLVGKQSPFQNAYNVKGNATSANII
uniref:Nucleoprotein n=1 Tax=Orthonairovirus haemorrhagiae TaxID=3052518 RepID=A0A6G5P5H2_9VIRU|nr:nucleoprotein precursor [Orthonairovirus haemorrhagiae]